MSSTPGSTRSDSSGDVYRPRVQKRRSLADFDKSRSYLFREISLVDVHHQRDSSESEENSKVDSKKRNKCNQSVKKSKKTKSSHQSDLNESLVEDDIAHTSRGKTGMFLPKNPQNPQNHENDIATRSKTSADSGMFLSNNPKNHENDRDTRSETCANLNNIVGESSSMGEKSISGVISSREGSSDRGKPTYQWVEIFQGRG